MPNGSEKSGNPRSVIGLAARMLLVTLGIEMVEEIWLPWMEK